MIYILGILVKVVIKFKLKQCETDDEVRTLLSEESSLDILQGICFRGVPMKANTSDRDKIVR